jgi:hypothetical protein
MTTTRKTTARQTRIAAEKVRYFDLARSLSLQHPRPAAVVEVTEVACGKSKRLIGYNVRFDTGVLVDGAYTFTPVAAFQAGERLF